MRRLAFVVAMMFLMSSLAAMAQIRKPSFGVKRKPDGTPEVVSVVPPKVQSPGTYTIKAKLANFAAGSKGKVSAEDPCNDIKDARVTDDEVTFTLTVDAMEETGDCPVYVSGDRGATVYVRILADPKAAEALKALQQKEQQQQQAQFQGKVNDFSRSIGKTWSVSFGSGKKEVWHYQGGTTGQASFKSASGQDIGVMMGNSSNEIMVMLPECMAQVKITGGMASADLQAPLCNNAQYQGKFLARISQ